jgi:hypothetical protein
MKTYRRRFHGIVLFRWPRQDGQIKQPALPLIACGRAPQYLQAAGSYLLDKASFFMRSPLPRITSGVNEQGQTAAQPGIPHSAHYYIYNKECLQGTEIPWNPFLPERPPKAPGKPAAMDISAPDPAFFDRIPGGSWYNPGHPRTQPSKGGAEWMWTTTS